MRTEPTPISVIVNFCEADYRFLSRCLASINWQLEPGDELIIVADGDIRNSDEIDHFVGKELTKCPTGQVALLQRVHRSGISAARNSGRAHARNDWIKFLDVDDLLAPFALNAIRQTIANLPATPSLPVVLIGGQGTVVNGRWVSDFHRVEGCLRTRQVNSVLFGDGLDQIKRSNPFLISHSVIHKSGLEAVGGFDERIHFEEDWDLWLKIHRSYGDEGFRFMPERICYYTIDDKLRAATKRDHTVDGVDVREYFRKTYGCNLS